MKQTKSKTQAKGMKITYEKKVEGPRIIRGEYVLSTVNPLEAPAGDTVEVAFLGRSNVGKSSLINSLCNHKGLALVSGTPGKTKTINYFAITSKEDIDEEHEKRYSWFLVDLPGYGYAKTDKGNRDRKVWSTFIADYIAQSDRLMLLCLLIDGRHPDLEIDQEAFHWLRSMDVPLQIVVTKIDKLNNSERTKAMKEIAQRYPTERPAILYSSLKHIGRGQLTTRINQVLVDV